LNPSSNARLTIKDKIMLIGTTEKLNLFINHNNDV